MKNASISLDVDVDRIRPALQKSHDPRASPRTPIPEPDQISACGSGNWLEPKFTDKGPLGATL